MGYSVPILHLLLVLFIQVPAELGFYHLCFITCEPCVCGLYTCHAYSLVSVYNDIVVPLLKNYPDALYFCDHRGTSVSQLLSMLNRHILSAEESDSDSSDSEVTSNSLSRTTDFAVSICVCMRPSRLDPSNHDVQCTCSQWRPYHFLAAARQWKKTGCAEKLLCSDADEDVQGNRLELGGCCHTPSPIFWHPAPSSPLCCTWSHHWRGTPYLCASVCQNHPCNFYKSHAFESFRVFPATEPKRFTTQFSPFCAPPPPQ